MYCIKRINNNKEYYYKSVDRSYLPDHSVESTTVEWVDTLEEAAAVDTVRVAEFINERYCRNRGEVAEISFMSYGTVAEMRALIDNLPPPTDCKEYISKPYVGSDK